MFSRKNKDRQPRKIARRATFSHDEKKLTVCTELEAVPTMQALRQASEAIEATEKALAASPADEALQEAYGRAVLELFACALGRDNVDRLLDLYGADLGDFMRDVKRFVFGVVLPAAKKAEARELKRGRTGAGWRWSNA